MRRQHGVSTTGIMKKLFTLCAGTILIFCASSQISAQTAAVFGKITERNTNVPIESALVFIVGTNNSIETSQSGEYALTIAANKPCTLKIQRLGYKDFEVGVEKLSVGTQRRFDIEMVQIDAKQEVIVRENRLNNTGTVHEDVKEFRLLPTTTGNLESLLPSIALGTNMGTGGELTSQYQVRGGNYDENLVYVNDFEVYRPQLIRAGQQEGLTFANPDLMRDLSFSSGGFEARYGDKMSSVLEIKYTRPDSMRGSVSASLLGATAHLEGSFKTNGKESRQRFRYLIGARYKTSKYLLSSLDVAGEYSPVFFDFQTYLTYDISNTWQLGILANYNSSTFNFTPQTRNTAFGLFTYSLGIRSVFEGKETDGFNNGMGGVSLTYLPEKQKNPLFLKFIASRYQTLETEGIDISGSYIIGEIETDPNKANAGQIVNSIGDGTQQTFARNRFWSAVTNIEHKGGYEMQLDPKNPKVNATNFFQWGIKYQNQIVNDQLSEWERIDSALYSLPRRADSLLLKKNYKSINDFSNDRYSAFGQITYTRRTDSVGELQANFGLRAFHATLNNESFVTPRFQILYKPYGKKNDISYKLAGGLYYQPSFYREMRAPNGSFNPNVVAQKSAQIIAGITYDFNVGFNRRIPFKFISEFYYKNLWDLVSYDVDNVRITYSGKNDATGHVVGLDMRLNGELVPGAESWINVSFAQARESIDGKQLYAFSLGDSAGTKVSSVPRPTNQTFTMSMFFQDYLPKNKNFKVHLNATFGSGLPFGLPDDNYKFRNAFSYTPYRRVDIGFSVLAWDAAWRGRKKSLFSFSRQTWLSLEVFNLLGVQNEASNTWVKTIYDTQFAVPNYLTSRRLNVRARIDF